MNSQFKIFIYCFSLVTVVQCTMNPATDFDPKYNPTSFEMTVSSTFPKMPIPIDNPLTLEGIALGRKLFYDPILSGDSTQSCSSCHLQKHAFGENKIFSTGIDKIEGTRNAMPLINSGWDQKLFWDGRATDLEEQALGPVENPIEMHTSWGHAIERIEKSTFYPSLFVDAFGKHTISKELVAKALSQFERTLISDNSKYDRVVRKEDSLTDQELRGLNMFFTEKADCFHCHGNVLFTDVSFHNTGLDRDYLDYGLELFSGRKRDRGKFKTPTLRNLIFTAPYMHDGRFATLEEVIDFYSEGVQNSTTIDPLMKNVHQGGVQLNEEEKGDLLAFLLTLTDSSFVNNPAFSNPFE